jgi:hypothetical protein
MQGARTINLAWSHAQAIADQLIAHGVTDAAGVTDLEWKLAASNAQAPAPDAETRRTVAVKIREHGLDPFRGLGAF